MVKEPVSNNYLMDIFQKAHSSVFLKAAQYSILLDTHSLVFITLLFMEIPTLFPLFLLLLLLLALPEYPWVLSGQNFHKWEHCIKLHI